MPWITTGIGRAGSSDAGRRTVDDARPEPASRWKTIRDTLGAVTGTVLGIAPHVLHHIGLLAGAALITGTTGNVLFYAIGLLLSVPMLRRLYRRFRSLWAPVIAVVVFTGLFSVSAFVIGPAISGNDDDTPPPSTPTDHGPGSRDEHGH
ncbi:hypothetical protein ACFVDI_27905 [Nocardioides sp. NPDC057767]|uniref:hypothetical protein n=1 Tax=unclassified Nocardioides TaxID=2615069 RepID=UPI00366A9CF5